jgi:hypothetical protein
MEPFSEYKQEERPIPARVWDGRFRVGATSQMGSTAVRGAGCSTQPASSGDQTFRRPPEHVQEHSVVGEVDDGGIWSWEEEILMACIPPPHEVRRFPVLMANLQDFAVTIMLAHVMPFDDNPVPDFRLHLSSLHCVEDS